MNLFGHFISAQALYSQLLVGLINGSFYALLSLGLAVIFGMLNIVNFAHGAFYMVGAFVAYFLLHLTEIEFFGARPFADIVIFGWRFTGINYWWALILAPLIVGALGAVVERTLIKQIAGLDHLYGLLLTFGLALIIQGVFQNEFGSSGMPYPTPAELRGPINQVRPGMGADIIAVVFAVVVIGGMGSIMGSVLTGFALGVIEGLTKVFYPEASNTVVFVIMAIVLIIRPSGLFGRVA